MVSFNRSQKEGFEKNAEEIKQALKNITEKVYSLIRTYSRTFRREPTYLAGNLHWNNCPMQCKALR